MTPVVELDRAELGGDGPPSAESVGPPLVLKLELLQHTGSFKPRGAFNAMLSVDAGEAGVIAASGGNFALAVAHAAGALGHRATIFVPESSPAAKIDRLRASGSEIVVAGAFYDDALAASRERAARTGALELHAFDSPAVVAGQGTCSRELDAQAPDLDTVVVAVGGGGLCAGAAAWFEEGVRIVAVEPAAAPTFHRALDAGRPVDVEVGGLAADSLGARRIGEVPWSLLRDRARSVQVADEAIRRAQLTLWSRLRVAAEPGGAAAFAALESGAYVPEPGERVGVLVCGANFDPAILG